jgi:drug/metabolite transporter (DMT)-like permease
LLANIAALFYVSFAWGTAFVFIKYAEETAAPLTIQSLRATIGFLTLLILSIILRKDIVGHAKHWFAFLVFAILGVAFLWIVTGLGEVYISAGLTSVLVTVAPMVTFIITVFILKNEPFSITGVAGLIVGVIGLLMVIGIKSIFSGGSTLTGVLLIVSGFAVFAVNGIIAPRLATGTDTLVSTTYYTGMAVVIMWIFTFIFENPLQTNFTEKFVLAEFYMGLVCFASAFVVYYWLLNRAGAFFSSLSFYLVPVMGVLGSFFFLGEKIKSIQVIGMLIVFLGVYLINTRRFGKN